MIGMTLCSGIGAPEMAAPWVDWRFASEIEPFPREVLQQRFDYKLPEDQNQGEALLWGDMTEVTPDLLKSRGIPLPDLIVAGTPCQAFSIAGLRKGVEDERGNLTLKFVEICHAIVDARSDGKLVVLWENVPGVLSDKGNAFGNFLAGLVGADDALFHPSGESWPSEGMVEGPRSRLAWRVLDAQYFGLAQRRRRVFVVVDFGGAIDPVEVLFERQGLQGNSAPRRETGPVASALTANGVGAGGDADDNAGQANHIIPVDWPAQIAPTLNAAFGDKQGLEDQHALNGAGLFVPIAFDCKGTEVQTDETGVPPPLRAMGHNKSHASGGGHAAVAFEPRYYTRGQGGAKGSDIVGALSSSFVGSSDKAPHVYQESSLAFKPAHYTRGKDGAPSDIGPPIAARGDGDQQAVVFSIMPQNSGKDYKAREVDVAQPLMANGPVGGNQGGDFVQRGPTVRRLMPMECARLQGFPDDHCAVTYRKKPATDGPQYKAYGNSMAVNNIKWIMDRIKGATI